MSDDLERLRRWAGSGGLVRILGDAGGRLSVGLLTCDGGEEMERVVTADPEVRRWCAEHAET